MATKNVPSYKALAATVLLGLPLAACGVNSDVDSLGQNLNGGKVDVCHREGNGGSHIINVSVNALPAHIAHGDHAVGPEVCDGVDNDCNGVADDGIAPQPTACGVGECASQGSLTCAGGQLVDSCKPGAPSPESCDSKDNDCNGATDEAGCTFPCAIGPSVKILNGSGGQVRAGKQGQCTTWATATVQVCRERADQRIYVSNAAGATSYALFDEVGTFKVTSPSSVTNGVNFRFWQADCLDPAYPDVYRPPVEEITSLFGNEVGNFTVSVEVKNAYQPYEWSDTWINRLP